MHRDALGAQRIPCGAWPPLRHVDILGDTLRIQHDGTEA